jgi:hypothetical protein
MRACLEVPPRLGNPNVPSITGIVSGQLDISPANPYNGECGGIEMADQGPGNAWMVCSFWWVRTHGHNVSAEKQVIISRNGTLQLPDFGILFSIG